MLSLHFHGFGQFFEQIKQHIDLEIGYNRSRVSNLAEMQSWQLIQNEIQMQEFNILDEVSSYTNNLSTSIGIKVYKGHHLRLRISERNVGSSLVGSAISTTGNTRNVTQLKYERNVTTGVGLAFLYEYVHAMNPTDLTFSIGLERQFFNSPSIMFIPNLSDGNYAVDAALGFTRPVHSVADIYGRIIITGAFGNDDLQETE